METNPRLSDMVTLHAFQSDSIGLNVDIDHSAFPLGLVLF